MENKNLKEILISDLKRMYQMIEIMEPKNEAEFIAIALPNLHLALFEWRKSKQEEIEGEIEKPLGIVADFVERWNKQDKEKDVAQAIEELLSIKKLNI